MGGVFPWLVNALQAVLWWVVSSLRAAGEAITSAILAVVGNYLPDLAAFLTSHQQTLAWVNHFFPLSETVSMGSTYFGLWVLVKSARIVRGMIPGLSR